MLGKAATCLLLLAVASAQSPNLQRARDLMSKNPTIDGHNDWPWQFRMRWQNKISDRNFYESQPTHTDIPRLREGLVGGQFWSVYVDCTNPSSQWTDDVRRTMEQIDVTRRLVDLYPEEFALALTAEDIRTAFADGKIASLIGMEGGHSLDNSLAALRLFYGAGARYMTLTHNCNLKWVDAHVDPVLGGLTEFGERVVLEMNRLGMLVDISHVSADVMHQVLDIALAPVIFSHSSARAVYNHTRNVPDDVLERLPENGGVVMVNFYSGFVCPSVSNCSLGDVANHIDHIVKTAGIDYVGLGADYDGVGDLPTGLEDVSTYPYLIAEMMDRGYSDSDCVKLMGGNIIRALEGAEQTAYDLRDQLPDETTEIEVKTCRNNDN